MVLYGEPPLQQNKKVIDPTVQVPFRVILEDLPVNLDKRRGRRR